MTTLQELDSQYDLSSAAFQTNNDTVWGGLQVALSASLPPNVVYNLTVYNVNTLSNGAPLYSSIANFSNAATLGITSNAASYLVASSSVTYTSTPRQIATNGSFVNLYILNCSDTAGWWITGYTPQSLAQTVYSLLAPYFNTTVMIQNTSQLNQILNGQPSSEENPSTIQSSSTRAVKPFLFPQILAVLDSILLKVMTLPTVLTPCTTTL